MDKNTHKFIGDRIKEAIKEKGISQYKLAKAVEISSSHLSDVINHKKEIGINKLVMLSFYLDKDINWFITGKTIHEAAIGDLAYQIEDVKDENGRVVDRRAIYNSKEYVPEILEKLFKLETMHRKTVLEMIDMYLKKQEVEGGEGRQKGPGENPVER